MENLVIVLLPLALGMGLRRIAAFPRDTGQALNMFVVYVSLPALVLTQVPKLPLSTELWVPVAMPWAMLAASAAAILGLAQLFGWERPVTGALLLVATLGNTSFLGVPMVQAFFGEGRVGYALLYDQMGSFLALATYGAVVLSVYGGAERATLGGIARRVLTFPPFLALLAAFALRAWPLPEVLQATLERLGDTLVPVVMVAVGFQFTLKLPRHHLGPLVAGLGLKLIAAPALALGLVTALGLQGEAVRVSVFEAGMAPMITAGALAMAAGLAAETVAAMLGLGILISLLTLPLLFMML